jgi:uncharacterized protein (TIGR02001 family)
MTRCNPMRGVRASAWVCVAVALLSAPAARAEFAWSGSLAVTSDYVQQGLSQTRGAAALQGGLRTQFDTRWTVGAWASTIDRNPGPGATLEIDVYAGRDWRLTDDWVASVTATHYFYPNDTPYVRYDYDEIAVSLGYRSAIFGTVSWNPNFSDVSWTRTAVDKRVLSYELTASQPLLRSMSGSLGAGYRDLSELFDSGYWYGHAGLMHATRTVTTHLTYTYVDRTARRLFGTERASPAWSAAVIWRFGSLD